MIRDMFVLFGRGILVGFVAFLLFMAYGIARAESTERETAHWAAGAYTATLVSVALKLQTLGIEKQKSYVMARRCAGEIESVSNEALQYMTKDSRLHDLSTAMVLVMHDRCGLLQEGRS